MKKILFLLALLVGNSALAADVKISALPAASAPDGTEVLPVVQGVTTKKMTTAQVKTWTLSGNAATATALAADGTDCSAGSYARGVDASGNASGCTAAGTGDVVGPASSIDNGIVRFDGTTGKLVQGNSGVTLADISGTASTMLTIAGNSLAINATAPTQTASAQAGVPLSVSASAAVAGSSNAGAAAGASVTVTAGAAARLTSGNANGGDINLAGGAGIGTGTNGQVNVTQAGTVAVPALTFGGDIASGIYRNSTNQLAVSTNGAARLVVSNTQIRTANSINIGWSSTSAATGTTDTGLERNAAGVMEVNNGTSATFAQVAVSGVQGNATLKALTESSATTFVKITIASGSFVAGNISYGIEANDATDFQVRGGIIPFTAVNKAGTITCTVGTVGAATETVSVSTGTLTNTFTCADAGSGILNLNANAVSSLTQTVLRIRYRTNVLGTTTIAPQ